MTPNQILILVSIITLGLLIYLITLLRGSIQKQETENDDDSKRDIEDIARAVEKLQENITRFKDPMGKLNAFMVGSSQAGSFAEWNLRSIISDFIPDEMVEENWRPDETSRKNVEFAIKLHNNLYLPIDAKNPIAHYEPYQEAIKKGDDAAAKEKKRELGRFVETQAAKISEYIKEGRTTNIAYMYIPSENCVSLIYGMKINNILLPDRVFRDNNVLVLGPNMLATQLTLVLHNQERINIGKRAEEIMEQLKNIENVFTTIKDRQRMTKVKLKDLKTSISFQDDNIEDLEETLDRIKSDNDE